MKLWQLRDWPSGYCRYLRLYPGRGDKWPFEIGIYGRVELRGEGGPLSH